MYNLQQPTKTIDVQKYSKILTELDLAAHLVYNSHAKKVLGEFYSEEQPIRKEKKTAAATTKTRGRSETKENCFEAINSMRAKRRQRKTRVEKTEFSIDDVKKFDNFYLKRPASFGNAKRP